MALNTIIAVWVATSFLSLTVTLVKGSSTLSIVGGNAYFNWTFQMLYVSWNRYIRSPANSSSLVVFNAGTATPTILDTRVTFTGELTWGIVSFILSNVKLTDAGMYTYVNALNEGELVQGGQVLIVAECPTIVGITDDSVSAVVGRDYILKCSAVSTSQPSDHGLIMLSAWKRNGASIMQGSKYSVNGTVLKITSLDRIDNRDRFTCTAFEDPLRKSAESNDFVLNVLYGPVNVTIAPSSILTVDEGRSLNITCTAECNPPCESYRWQKDAQDIQAGYSPSYVVADIRRVHSGIYTCTVTNTKIYSSAAAQISVQVNYPPSITIESRNGSYNEIGLTLKCLAHGFPEKYTFRLTHSSLFSSIHIRELRYELVSAGVIVHTFTNLSYMDTGIYTCTANNGILDYRDGLLDQHSRQTLWIKGVPYVTSAQMSFYAEIGNTGRLFIEFYSSFLDPLVTWYKYKSGTLEKIQNTDKYNVILATTMVNLHVYLVHVLQPGSLAILEIRNVTEEDLILYQVHVQNSVGDITPVILELTAKGSIPDGNTKNVTGGLIIGIAVGSAVFVTIVVAAVGIILYRRRNAFDAAGSQEHECNRLGSLGPTAGTIEHTHHNDKEELRHIGREDDQIVRNSSSGIKTYETICSTATDQECAYNSLAKGETNAYENTNLSGIGV